MDWAGRGYDELQYISCLCDDVLKDRISLRIVVLYMVLGSLGATLGNWSNQKVLFLFLPTFTSWLTAKLVGGFLLHGQSVPPFSGCGCMKGQQWSCYVAVPALKLGAGERIPKASLSQKSRPKWTCHIVKVYKGGKEEESLTTSF